LNLRSFPLLAAIALLLGVFPVQCAEQGQLDASEALFTVMAAANAAGYDAGLSSSPPIRQQVRDRVAASQAPVLKELRAWYHQNPEPDKTQDLARFISLGLSVKDVPDFEWAKRIVEVPPDAMAMDDFRKLLPRFFEEAKIDDIWQVSQKAVESALERYQGPVAQAVLEVNGYLRNPVHEFLGRRFQIYIDFLGAPNQVQTRSFGDDYFVVLTASDDLRTFDVRHAYFRYMVDPLALKYGMALKEKASLMDIAEGAPLLREPYRSSFDLLATECLIKAIESRLLKNPHLIDQDLREGYILTPFFNEQMAIYEKGQESMRVFFPQMVQALSVKHEIQRLDGVEFAKALPLNATAPGQHGEPHGAQAAELETSVAARSVNAADDYLHKRDLDSANKLYTRALQQPGSQAEHARAYYGLAHVELLSKKPDEAEEMFHKALDSAPDADVQAWTCYYLGKLATLRDARDEAMKWYQKAVAVKGAPDKAIEFTRKGIAELDHPAAPPASQ
jgi:hypothetical protein